MSWQSFLKFQIAWHRLLLDDYIEPIDHISKISCLTMQTPRSTVTCRPLHLDRGTRDQQLVANVDVVVLEARAQGLGLGWSDILAQLKLAAGTKALTVAEWRAANEWLDKLPEHAA